VDNLIKGALEAACGAHASMFRQRRMRLDCEIDMKQRSATVETPAFFPFVLFSVLIVISAISEQLASNLQSNLTTNCLCSSLQNQLCSAVASYASRSALETEPHRTQAPRHSISHHLATPTLTTLGFFPIIPAELLGWLGLLRFSASPPLHSERLP